MVKVEQVGGQHYAAEYQHWDWCDDTDMPYLEGCATKYIQRWRDKGGLEDLRKARSYLLKAEANPYHMFPGMRNERSPELLERYLSSSQVPEREASIIRAVDSWEIGLAPILLLEDLIREVEDAGA